MKYTRSGNSTYLIILIALLFSISCSKKETPTPKPPPPTPTNTSPVASFTVSPTSGDINTVFVFDASTCSDAQTAMASLQVRWDYTNDGTYDTEWSTTKTMSGSFPDAGNYTVKLEVKDAGGLTATTTRAVVVESGAFTDSRDGKTYNTITVGGMTWMDDNLAYELPGKQITDASAWSSNSLYDAWTYYDNDKDAYGDIYGILYQFEAAIAAIPDGWHLPTELEIRALTESLGGASIAGGKLKEEGITHWTTPNTGATNSSGYTGLPGGFRDENGAFSGVGDYASYWSATIYSLLDSWFWYLSYDESSVSWFTYPKTRGYTVRCVKDQDNNTAPTASFTVSPTSGDVNTAFTFDASGSSDNESADSDLYVRWDYDNDGTFDTEWSKTKTVSHTYTTTGTYTAKLEVEDEGGLVSSTTQSIVVSDAAAANNAPTASFSWDPETGDANTQFTFDASTSTDDETAATDLEVKWSTKGGAGNSFSSSWTTTKTATSAFGRSNDAVPSDYPMTYAIKLEVKDSEGLIGSLSKDLVVAAPQHPLQKCTVSPVEGYTWTKFTFDGSESWDGQTASKNLEYSWVFDYSDPEEGDGGNGNNEFSTGWINSNTTSFSSYPSTGTWWISFSVRDPDGNSHWNFAHLSVAILPNTNPTASFTIDPSSGNMNTNFSFDASGSSDSESISDSLYVRWDFDNDGTFEVDWTKTKTTTHTYSASGNYTVNMEVKDQGDLISSTTTIIQIESGTMTDSRDNKTYKTVEIGSQTWFAENLSYLPSVSSPEDGSYTDSYYYVYGYVGSNVSAAKATDNYLTYGVLYNWPAAMGESTSSNTNPSGVQGACPSGWHLPSDNEWKQLEKYLGMSQSEADDTGYRGTNEGKKLKSTSGWYDNGNGTDNFGFNALPGGYRYKNGSFNDLTSYGIFWSSSETNINSAWYRYFYYFHDDIYRDDYNKGNGVSIRCIKD